MLPEAQLYYYKAREYDPVFGRFLQTDPIGSKDDLDLYAYTGDDPIDKTDPTGTDGLPLPSLGTIGYAAAAAGVEVVGLGPEDPVGDAGAAYFARRAALSYAGNMARAAVVNTLKPDDLKGKTRDQIRDLAKALGFKPHPNNDPNDPKKKEKFLDPVNNKQRIRIDPGHKDPDTGKPYDDPKAAQDHVHGYEDDGKTSSRPRRWK